MEETGSNIIERVRNLVGKVCVVVVPERDNYGKLSGRHTTIKGMCTFVGSNKFVDSKHYAVVGRVPCILSSWEEIWEDKGNGKRGVLEEENKVSPI